MRTIRFCSRAGVRALASLLLVASPTLAVESSAEPVRLTPYERQTVRESAERLGIRPERDAAPEGKLVESVDIVVLDVFDEHDPVPDFVNVFHTMTREGVVRRELLVGRGDVYLQRRADEAARNLRKLRQLSLVLIVPLKGSAPDRVRVLVIVKDVWSLRMNSDFAVSDSGLSYLVLNPSEENLAGTHASLGGLFKLDPGSYSFGGIVSQRRIGGTDLEGLVGVNLIYNRENGDPEGSYGYFAYGEPILRTTDEWGWGTGLYFRHDVSRRFRGDTVGTYDAPSTLEDDRLPILYRGERITSAVEVVRSFGRERKYDVSIGVDADRRSYRYSPPPGTAPSAARDFERVWLPVSDTRIGPFAGLYSHEERYLRTVELETLGLQEDFRLGPELVLKLSAASADVGSTRTSVGISTGASFTGALGNGLFRVVASNAVEYAWDGRHDASCRLSLRFASPRLGFGRLVADGIFRERYRNHLNLRFALGGDGRLRGYPSSTFDDSFTGSHAFVGNVEFRSTSVDILTAQTGLAAFYDVGHAAMRFRDLFPRHALGAGVRILFPQASRTVFRADWAFPLNPVPGASTFPGGFFVTFGQAFDIPELAEGSLANPETYLSTVPK